MRFASVLVFRPGNRDNMFSPQQPADRTSGHEGSTRLRGRNTSHVCRIFGSCCRVSLGPDQRLSPGEPVLRADLGRVYFLVYGQTRVSREGEGLT